MERAVIEHIQLSTETKVLLIGRHKLQTNAGILVHIDRVVNVEMIERDCRRSDRTWKLLLQEAHLIVVNINVAEHILYHRVQSLARLDELTDTLGGLPHYDVLLTLRCFTIDMLYQRLVYRYRKYQLLVIWTDFNLFQQPR